MPTAVDFKIYTSFKLPSACEYHTPGTLHNPRVGRQQFRQSQEEIKDRALFQRCSTGQWELLSEMSGCLWCLLCHICSVRASSTHSKGRYSLVFSFAGITDVFMRHKPLVECLSPGSCLSRNSHDRDWKTDCPTGEKLKFSMFSSLTITYVVVSSGHAIVLCVSNPETINTFKSPRTATTGLSHCLPFYFNPTASSKALFTLFLFSHMLMETSSSHGTLSGILCLL